MGFWNDLSTELKSDAMKTKGIYSTDNMSKSCLCCIYWDSSSENCSYHRVSFNGSAKRCSNWESK
jgi:hypothetical protein